LGGCSEKVVVEKTIHSYSPLAKKVSNTVAQQARDLHISCLSIVLASQTKRIHNYIFKKELGGFQTPTNNPNIPIS
jgi:hypothetical protein